MIVLITGASKGIGRATAIEMANLGYEVVAVARSEEKLKELASSNRNITYFVADVTDRNQINNTIHTIEVLKGPIDIAFLNAGGFVSGKPAWFGDAFRETIDLNFGGTVNCLEAIVPHMVNRKKGHIILMSSVTAYSGLPMFSPEYSISKSAILMLAETFYEKLKKKNIKLQIVCPSFIDTGLMSKRIFNMPFIVSPEKAAKKIVNGIKSNKFEIAFPWPTVLYLKLISILPYPICFWFSKYTMGKIRK
jgi:short-subunit dehydrogenase